MNSRTLARAVGSALVLSSGAAVAYVPTSNTDADIVLYWGGATASTVSAQELTVNALCDTDVHIVYVRTQTDANPARRNAPGNDWAVACRTAPVGQTPRSGLPNDKRLLIVKRDRGGSGVGVGPLQTNTAFTFLTINSTNCPDVITPGDNGAPVVIGPGGTQVSLVGCPNSIAAATLYSTSRLIEIGTSDIEPDKFIGINTPVVDGTGQPFLNGVGFGDVQALSALTFNTPVTLTLYRALQNAQFPAGSVCNPGNAAYGTVISVPGNIRTDITNGESEACMPSLTKQEINSLLTGRIATWSQLLTAGGAAIGSGAVQICRRVEGSGTQATINALISNFPCDPNAADGAFDIIQPRNTASATLVLNSGSSDVATCLSTFEASATNKLAIGVLSVEGRNNNNSAGYRYIKVDGVAPTLQNIHRGDYWFWAQQTCQRRNYATLNSNAAVTTDDTTANRTTAFNALCGATSTNSLGAFSALLKLNNPQNPTNCAAGGSSANLAQCGSLYPWGQSGWLATATSAQVYDNVLLDTRPVNAWTREVATGRVNICQVPVKSTAGGNFGRGVVVAPNPTWTP